MKTFLLCAAMMAAMPASAESVKLHMKARIINLTLMPIDEAVRFCDDRNMACPELRRQAEQMRTNKVARQISNTNSNNVQTIRTASY